MLPQIGVPARQASPPTDDRPTSPLCRKSRHDEWLARRTEEAKRMAQRVKARKVAAQQAEQVRRECEQKKTKMMRKRVRRCADRVARQAESVPAAKVVLEKEVKMAGKQLWGANNHAAHQQRGLLTKKAEAAKARQQATAMRIKEQPRTRANAQKHLEVALDQIDETANDSAKNIPLRNAVRAATAAGVNSISLGRAQQALVGRLMTRCIESCSTNDQLKETSECIALDNTPVQRATPDSGCPIELADSTRDLGKTNPRSKPLWAASESELLAELERRRQTNITRCTPSQIHQLHDVTDVSKNSIGTPATQRKHMQNNSADDLNSTVEDLRRAEIAKRVAEKEQAAAERMQLKKDALKAKAIQAAERRARAQARFLARRAEKSLADSATCSETEKNVDQVQVAQGEPQSSCTLDMPTAAPGTHAAHMRQLMMKARAQRAQAIAHQEAIAAAADRLQAERTVIEDDGTKWRIQPDGSRVKVVRKACPQGQALKTAVHEMAKEAGWSQYKLQSRLGGFGSEEQGLRSIWLLFRRDQKTKLKLEKLRAEQENTTS